MSLTRKFLPLLALPAALGLVFAAACGDDEEEKAPGPSGEGSPGASAAAAQTNGPPTKVTFMAGFKPQANLPFAGAYVAQEKGFFADENLEVEIRHVTTPGDNFRFLAAGEIQFSTSDAPALLEKWAGDPALPIVSIALVGQKGQQGFAVLADSGIKTPADWAGKTAGYKGSQVTPDYLAILEANGVDPSAVKEVRVGFEPQVLTEHQVDIYPVFLSNEPDTLRRLGFQTRVFEAAQYGAPTLGLTYVATADYVNEHPDTVKRFLRAALRGINYALSHREEALDIVMKYAPNEDREHQKYMLDTELQAAIIGTAYQEGIGWQTQEQWQTLHDFLVKYGGLAKPLSDIPGVFTNQFVDDIYDKGQIAPAQ
ncbi:MAG: ABC transporter substrate-binding protein [Dehalococcoidia bacterium]|nr:ABC transporter substrate-binding protein [Dehalococcoidia bacterium]